MSAKAISEAKGKELLNKHLGNVAMKNRFAKVDENINWNQVVQDNAWLTSEVSAAFHFLNTSYIFS